MNEKRRNTMRWVLIGLSLVTVTSVAILLIYIPTSNAQIIRSNENSAIMNEKIRQLNEELLDMRNTSLEEELIILRNEVENKNKKIQSLEKAMTNKTEENLTLLEHMNNWNRYMKPSEIIGEWRAVDVIDYYETFDPSDHKAALDGLWFKGLKFVTKSVMADFGDGYKSSSSWHDDNIDFGDNASEFMIKRMDGKDYLFMELKNGDYFNGHEPGFYIFERAE